MFVSYSLTGGGHFEQACEGECKDQPTAAVSKRPLAPMHSNYEMFTKSLPLALPWPSLQSLSLPLSISGIYKNKYQVKETICTFGLENRYFAFQKAATKK